MFNCAVGREEHCKQISLVCVGSVCGECSHVWATLDLPTLTVCVLSQSTLLRLHVALQGNCLRWALGCGHFPGLRCSVQVLRYSTKSQTRLGLCFVPFPGLSSSDDQLLGKRTFPRCGASYHLLVETAQFPGCAAGALSQVCHVSPLGN